MQMLQIQPPKTNGYWNTSISPDDVLTIQWIEKDDDELPPSEEDPAGSGDDETR